MDIHKVLRTCTAGIYRNFFNQSSSQQVLRVAFPLIALGAIALLVYWRWTATPGPIPKNPEDDESGSKPKTIDSTDKKKNLEVTSTQPKPVSSNYSCTLDDFRSTKEEYALGLDPITCTASNFRRVTSDLVDASMFFQNACDHEGDIRLWSTDESRKMQKSGFLALAKQWADQGGKFIYPKIYEPVVVDSTTLCLPWCHEEKNRSALVYDYLMRAGHHETLLPEGAKEGHLFPSLEPMDDTEDGRYPVIKDKTGFKNGKVFRIGDKLIANGIDLQQGFTDLFNQLLNRPVMIFAFVSAVPILMREILLRTEGKNLSNITMVAFHHDDPMNVPSPLKQDQANDNEAWVVKNSLQGTLYRAQELYKHWYNASQSNAKLRAAGKDPNDPDRAYLTDRCKELSEKMAPLEANLLFHRRRHAVNQFQNEVLAQLICVRKDEAKPDGSEKSG